MSVDFLELAAREISLAQQNLELARTTSNPAVRESSIRFAREHWTKARLLMATQKTDVVVGPHD